MFYFPKTARSCAGHWLTGSPYREGGVRRGHGLRSFRLSAFSFRLRILHVARAGVSRCSRFSWSLKIKIPHPGTTYRLLRPQRESVRLWLAVRFLHRSKGLGPGIRREKMSWYGNGNMNIL